MTIDFNVMFCTGVCIDCITSMNPEKLKYALAFGAVYRECTLCYM